MAELARANEGCCTPEVQAACCEPAEKQGCCMADSTACGCPAGRQITDIEVRATHCVHEHAAAGRIRATKPS